jgi:hypothetical protein
MTESIRDRLDREAEEQKARQSDSMTRVSDSFISGIEHAANIAHRMERNFVPKDKLTDLRDRLVNADHSLRNHITVTDRTPEDVARLNGKAEGVRLAMSYLDEITREL